MITIAFQSICLLSMNLLKFRLIEKTDNLLILVLKHSLVCFQNHSSSQILASQIRQKSRAAREVKAEQEFIFCFQEFIFRLISLMFCLMCLFVLYVILAFWPPVLQSSCPLCFLFVFYSFCFFVVRSFF